MATRDTLFSFLQALYKVYFHCVLLRFPSGILTETRKWVGPFVANSKLRSAFFEYSKLPGTYEKLNELSAYVSTSLDQIVYRRRGGGDINMHPPSGKGY